MVKKLHHDAFRFFFLKKRKKKGKRSKLPKRNIAIFKI